jgi:hypothetical protein
MPEFEMCDTIPLWNLNLCLSIILADMKLFRKMHVLIVKDTDQNRFPKNLTFSVTANITVRLTFVLL